MTSVTVGLLGRAMIEKHLAGQHYRYSEASVKKSDFSTERKLYILKPRFLDLTHSRPGFARTCAARPLLFCGVPPGPKEKY